MKKSTEKALWGSVEKWYKIYMGTGRNLDALNCPLCKKFLLGKTSSCVGCPVFNKTGRFYCLGSPFDDYARYGTKRSALKEYQFLVDLALSEEPS